MTTFNLLRFPWARDIWRRERDSNPRSTSRCLTVFISEKGALVNSIVILAFCPVPNKTRGKRQQITSARVAFTLREVSLLVDLQLSVGCTGHLLTNRAKPLHSSLRAPMHNMSCAKAEGCPIKYVGVLPQKTVRAHPRSPFRKHMSSP